MSTAMGTADKSPMRLTVILANQCVTRNMEFLQKLKKMVEFVATKIAEMFLSVREEFEFRGFEITYHHCYITGYRHKFLQTRPNKKDITLGFFVGEFTHFTSSNNDAQNCFLVPDKVMQMLPENFCNEDLWNEEMRVKIRKLMCHMVHEVFRSLGAFHADDGIMSKDFVGLPTGQKLNDIKLLHHVDHKTVTIVCESLSIITTLSPERNLKFNPAINRVTYETDQSIAAAFFVQNGKYTELYREYTYLDACKRYTELIPEKWDGLVIVHFCGHIYYYSKEDVLTTKLCTKSIVF